jgi:hypothetical protein
LEFINAGLSSKIGKRVPPASAAAPTRRASTVAPCALRAIPFPERALNFLNRALDAIQAAQIDEHPVRVGVALDGVSANVPHILPAVPQVVASFALLGDDEILCDADYDSKSTDLVDEDLDADALDCAIEDVPREFRHVPWHGDPLHTL